jgi:hypothetical protein
MTIENKFLIKLNLQIFAEGEDDNTPPTSGEEDLQAAIRSLIASENEEEDDESEDNAIDESIDEEESEDDDSTDEEDEEYGDEDDDDEEEPPVKKQQSKEDNAKFAQKRREEEARKRAEAELERLKQEAPEFKLAQMLSDQFGKPVEDIMKEIQEEQIKQEAEKSGRSVEDIRQQREQADKLTNLEKQNAMLQFKFWELQVKADGDRLMNEYKMLTQEDIDKATDYILNTAKNVELPLEDAVFAVHGKKIVDALAKGKVQENLAEQSGRKRKTPLAPNNSKPSKVVTLTEQEKQIARMYGMTDEEYAKYKS